MLKYKNVPVDLSIQLTAVEVLLDVLEASPGEGSVDWFVERVNERARLFRIGVRLEGTRFMPVGSEHMHTTVVRPALVFLSEERLTDVDTLYRKAFDRQLNGDPSGAITPRRRR